LKVWPVVPLGLVLALAAVSCQTAGPDQHPPIVQPGAPGQPSRTIAVAAATEMTALVPARTSRDAMKLLAQRIEVSQRDEIAMMRGWLRARAQPVPDAHAHHQAGALMPGILTAEEMAHLAAASGPAFDRLFLESMIKHHDGALVMVKDLFATPGAGHDPEIFAFASDVDADQRMEIARMGALLKEWQP